MGNSLFAYLELLELLGFFSGYPLVYAIVLLLPAGKSGKWKPRLFGLLPFAYGLAGVLYIGMRVSNVYPDLQFQAMFSEMQRPLVVAWGVSAIFFLIPFLARKPLYSLLHSLVFFYFIVVDMARNFSGKGADNHIIKNDMKLYLDSVLLLSSLLLFLFLLTTLVKRWNARRSDAKG